MEKNKLLIVSLDAVSTDDIAILADCPTFRSLSEGGTLVSDVHPVYLSNTYPIHTAIVTGCQPYKHGILDNTLPVPGDPSPDWNWFSKKIKTPTLYNEAIKLGLVAASLFWPVTAKSAIRYNIPEILPTRPWQNQIILSLFNGNALFSIASILKFGKQLRGSAQPQLDDFSCAVLCDLIRQKTPDLMMIHFTDADTQKHHYGIHSDEAKAAIKRMDLRLGDLVAALKDSGTLESCHIIIFSDHGMTDVVRSINPNKYLEESGLLTYLPNGRLSSWKAWIKCCGGSGFLYLNDPRDKGTLRRATDLIHELSSASVSGIKGFLDDEEFLLSGFNQESAFGIMPTEGTEFVEHAHNAHHANHGYSLKDKKYNTFYLLSGPRIKSGSRLSGGSLLDIAPLAATLLAVPLWEMDGVLRTELLKTMDD